MKPFAVAVSLALLLAACAPLRIYHKPGVPVPQWRSDTTTCEVQALRDAPVATQTRQEPPVFVPPRQICNSSGDCRLTGGYWYPGEIYTVDVNAGLRNRVETQCMAQRGYVPVEIPRCPDGVSVRGRTTVLPELGANACFVRFDDGGIAIVNRG
jgi:hypothetical protein